MGVAEAALSMHVRFADGTHPSPREPTFHAILVIVVPTRQGRNALPFLVLADTDSAGGVVSVDRARNVGRMLEPQIRNAVR